MGMMIDDRLALDCIADCLSGKAWTADTCAEIASILRDAGYEIADDAPLPVSETRCEFCGSSHVLADCPNIDRDQLVYALMCEFDQMLRWHMMGDHYHEAVALNRAERDPHVCHTHDYHDSNVSMAQAFATALGREARPESAEDASIWSEAWGAWKRVYCAPTVGETPTPDGR
jgi:hypothetical protein